MMKKIITVLSFAVLTVTACKQKKSASEFKELDGGMMFKLIEDEDGKTIKEDEFAAITYTEKTESDSLILDTNDFDERWWLMFRERAYFKGDFHAALGMLSEGDSAVFKIRLDSIIAKTGRRDIEHVKGKYLIYNVRVHKVVARGSFTDDQFNDAIMALRDAEDQKAKNNEPEKLKRYLSSLKTKPLTTASGLNYLLKRSGTGIKARPGDTVEVNYTARFLSGRAFETSDSLIAKKLGIYRPSVTYGPLKLLVAKKFESGFDEALVAFPEGTSVSLILPSQRAYKEDGHGSIKPFTPLLCDLEILDVIQSSGKPVAMQPHVHK